MNNSALKYPPQVNLDEFEQRLRMAGSPIDPQEDPLEELARLVGLDSREKDAPDRPLEATPPLRLPHAPLLQVAQSRSEKRQFEDLGDAEPGMMDEASLRGALEDEASPRGAAHPSAWTHEDVADHDGPAPYHDDAAPAVQAVPRRRSGRIALTMGALVVIGAAGGLAAVWVAKGAPGLPKSPPLILAAQGPTKVQPPTQETISSPSDTASVLLKDQTNKPGPVNLVSNQEQPVDLRQQAASQPAPVAAAAPPPPTPAPAPSVSPSAPAAPVPAPTVVSSAPAPTVAPPIPATPPAATAPTPPSTALTTVGPTTAAPAAPTPFPEPKRVKTVSVRPDGSVISSGSEPAVADAAAPAKNAAPAEAAAAADTAPQPANPPVPRARPSFDAAASGAAQATTPKLELPTKLSPKSTARVPVAKTDTTVASGNSQSPETPLQVVPDLPRRTGKGMTSQPDVQVAANDPAAPLTRASTSGGAYAVQLAAPPSEKEAQGASTRLQAKYAAELGGMQPSIHQADSNGRTIYRVRLSGMSKAEAVTLCQKIKASGGDGACFVAKD